MRGICALESSSFNNVTTNYSCLFYRSNILLDEHLTTKLADFGFSIQMPETVGNVALISAQDGLPGTNGYRPPEFSDGHYSVRSDVYSLGVVSVYGG